MNYPPNTTRWKTGDLVLHDADAKRPEMLMVVLGYNKDGLCCTRYIADGANKEVWKNTVDVLHDPARFGVKPPPAEPAHIDGRVAEIGNLDCLGGATGIVIAADRDSIRACPDNLYGAAVRVTRLRPPPHRAHPNDPNPIPAEIPADRPDQLAAAIAEGYTQEAHHAQG